jgi:hypothetical protein
VLGTALLVTANMISLRSGNQNSVGRQRQYTRESTGIAVDSVPCHVFYRSISVIVQNYFTREVPCSILGPDTGYPV